MGNSGEWEYKIIHTADGSLFSNDTLPMEDTLNSLGGGDWELADTIADLRGAGASNG